MATSLLKLSILLKTKHGNLDFDIAEMSGGASPKKFFRLSGDLAGQWNQPSLIVQLMTSAAHSASDFYQIHRFLDNHGVSVPTIFFYDLEHSYFLLEDLGPHSLEFLCATDRNPGSATQAFKMALDQLLLIQSVEPDPACVAFQRRFDSEKYKFEHAFHFKTHVIQNYFRYSLSPEEEKALDGLNDELTRTLEPLSTVFSHRDYQSSNLFITGSRLSVIDFQDARIGNPFYDLVSLIEDVYVTIGDSLKSELKEYYIQRARLPEVWIKNFSRLYHFTLLQRKLHDAGAFFYCYENIGNQKYLTYIPSALSVALSVLVRYPEFHNAAEILNSIMGHGRDNKK